MFDTFSDWLLLPAGAAFGWALAQRGGWLRTPGGADKAVPRTDSPSANSSDDAVAALSAAVTQSPASLELQLTLAELFRRRGEIDRALHLHQALIDRAPPDSDLYARARIGLARDYLKGGVIDRAEDIALSLIESGQRVSDALDLQLELCEQTRDWLRAIRVAGDWQAVHGRSAAARIAQYQCELAEAALAGHGESALHSALEHAQKAAAADEACLRAHLLLAQLAQRRQRPAEALPHFHKLLLLEPVFAGEISTAVRSCLESLGDCRDTQDFLADLAALKPAQGPAALALLRLRATLGLLPYPVLTESLQQQPSLDGLVLWLESGVTDTRLPEEARAVATSLQKRLASRPRYLCRHCGFSTSVLFWQCPSCKSWGAVKPAETAI